MRPKYDKSSYLVAFYPWLLICLGVHPIEFEVIPCSENKISFKLLDSVESFKVIVAPIKYVITTSFIRNVIHRIDTINRCWCNINKAGYPGFNVIECVHFDSTFRLSELRPPENIQTEINGRRVKRINIAIDFHFKVITNTYSAGVVDKMKSKLFV